METVNSIASAASRAIWGEQGQQTTEGNEILGSEPVSGKTGNVQAGEPYDRGNDGETGITSSTHPSTSTAAGTTAMDSTTGTTTGSTTEGSKLPTFLNYQKGDDTNTSTTTDRSTYGINDSSNSTTTDRNTTTGTTSTSDTYNNNSTTNTSSGRDNKLGTSGLSSNTANPGTSSTTSESDYSNPMSHAASSTVKPTNTLTDTTPSTGVPSHTKDNTTSNTVSKTASNAAPSDAQPATAPPKTATSSDAAKNTTKDDELDEKKNGRGETVKPDNENTPKGIHETTKAGDHAPKYDTFQSDGGPHIDSPATDGRVGPDIPKGEIDDELLKKEEKGERSGAVGGESRARDSVDSAGKEGHGHGKDGGEKVSLKDKIKAKLHKH